jgi:hypothetical protein
MIQSLHKIPTSEHCCTGDKAFAIWAPRRHSDINHNIWYTLLHIAYEQVNVSIWRNAESIFRIKIFIRAWRYTLIPQALGRLRQKHHKFEVK